MNQATTLKPWLFIIFLVNLISFQANAAGSCTPPANGQCSDAFTVKEYSAFGNCKRVNNSHASGLIIFIPQKTNTEWASFYNNPPAGVTISACTTQVIALTSGSSWTVPLDWNNASNSIEVIGGGGGSLASVSPGQLNGGGGGAYSKITNLNLTPGSAVSYSVGAAGIGGVTPSDGGATWFSSSGTVMATGGQGADPSFVGQGGLAIAGVGTVKYSGGSGGASGTTGGGGGGGAAGPNGNGGDGGDGGTTGAGGGGGANGGVSGSSGSGATSGAGGNNRLGVGGGGTAGGGGSNGGGGGGNTSGNGGYGGIDQVWSITSGGTSGVGGGGGGSGSNVGGSSFGFGAAGGAANVTAGTSTGGLIIITYSPL